MRQSNKIGGVAQKIISTVFFLVTFICLLYLYITVKYLPFFLAAIIVIMPVAVNTLLHLFACKIPAQKPTKRVFDESTKKSKKAFSTIAYAIKLSAYGISVAYNSVHKILQIVFVLGAFAAFQIMFGIMLLKLTSLYNPLNFVYPIIFAILFVVSIIIDKWIKHSEAINDRTEAFFHNSRVFFYLTRL